MQEVRLIDANSLIDKLDEMICQAIVDETTIHYSQVRELIAEQPTIEPEVRCNNELSAGKGGCLK